MAGSQAEAIAPKDLPLSKRVLGHFDRATQGAKGWSGERLLSLIESFESISTVDARGFLIGLDNPRIDLTPIGYDGLRPEGLIFQATQTDVLSKPLSINKNRQSRIIKLFEGGFSQYPLELAQALHKIYADDGGVSYNPTTIFGKKSPIQIGPIMRSQKDLPLDGLISTKPESIEEARYFASAEIMSRTMAHAVLPEVLPKPVAIIDISQEPIGFYLDHDKAATNAMDSHRKSTLYDMGPLGTSYPWNEDLPDETPHEIKKKLESFNIIVYNGSGSDVQEQVLYDLMQPKNNQFVNFARLGYRFSQLRF